MNYDKKYLDRYEIEYDCDLIVDKKNNNVSQTNINDNNNENTNKDNVLLLQNKAEELFLKLKFINSNKKYLSSEILNNIDEIDNSKNVISLIEKIIFKLDNKIICKGQIKRKNNSFDFEF